MYFQLRGRKGMKMPKLAMAMMRSVTQATAWKECRGLDQPFTRDRRGGEAHLPPASGTTRLQLLLHKSICKMGGGQPGRVWTPPAACVARGPQGCPALEADGGWGALQGPGESCICLGHSSDATLLEGVRPTGPRTQERHYQDPSAGMAVTTSVECGLRLQMGTDSSENLSHAGRRRPSG